MSNRNQIRTGSWRADLPGRLTSNGAAAKMDGEIAAIYNQAGDEYAAYADGAQRDLFAFEGPHAYADRCVWTRLETKLSELRAAGTCSVRLLDAGCGPGTWLRRLVTKALDLGFKDIHARGFDIAQAQIERARSMARSLASIPGVSLTFDIANLEAPLPEADASVDLAVCLYSVLSHLPAASLSQIAVEIARVTSGHFITTVRPVGSPPTAFVAAMETTLEVNRDHDSNRCAIEFRDGRRIATRFSLFTASELRTYFSETFEIEELRGVDLFFSRFTPDARWNPPGLIADRRLFDRLEELEEAYAANPAFLDRASHLLLVARRRHPKSCNTDM